METTIFSPGNITTGQLAEKMGSSIIGQVGYFYKNGTAGGALHPMYARRLVKVTGFYRDRGVMAFTFSDVTSVNGGFIRLSGVKFAAFADQDEANAVFSHRYQLVAEIRKVYNHAAATEDKDAMAYTRAAMEGLMTVD